MSPMIYNNFQSTTEFKADMHHLYIQAWKDLEQSWVILPFMATDEEIYAVLAVWPLEWHTPDKAILDQLATQQQKKDHHHQLMHLP